MHAQGCPIIASTIIMTKLPCLVQQNVFPPVLYMSFPNKYIGSIIVIQVTRERLNYRMTDFGCNRKLGWPRGLFLHIIGMH